MIKNYMEQLVNEVINDLVKSKGENFFCCNCSSCIDKIRVYTLNQITPFYVTSKTGEVYGTFSNKAVQKKADILSYVLKANEIVSNKKNH